MELLTQNELDKTKYLYFNQKESMPNISRIMGVSVSAIYYRLSKYKQPIRSKTQSQRLRRQKEKQYKPGRHKTWNGYIEVRLLPEDPFYCMAKRSDYVTEHRYIVAKYLGRPLQSGEIVHHLNGIRDDNRFGNLALVNKHNHPRGTYIKLLEKHVRDLEAKLSQQKLPLSSHLFK